MTEEEMVGWYHLLNAHEFELAPGDSEGQGSLACCSPRGHKESDTAERLNNNHLMFFHHENASLFHLNSFNTLSSPYFPPHLDPIAQVS